MKRDRAGQDRGGREGGRTNAGKVGNSAVTEVRGSEGIEEGGVKMEATQATYQEAKSKEGEMLQLGGPKGTVGTQGIEQGEWEMEAVLAAGAACAFHPRAMPDQLLELVVPQLVGAVLAVPQPHSGVAGALLADGLVGSASSRWRPLLGDISALLQQ
jgi:hypothetical protein